VLNVSGRGADASHHRIAHLATGNKAQRVDLMARKPQPSEPSSWDIYLARHTPAKFIGTVEATDADAAIEQAAKLYNVQDVKKLISVRRL